MPLYSAINAAAPVNKLQFHGLVGLSAQAMEIGEHVRDIPRRTPTPL